MTVIFINDWRVNMSRIQRDPSSFNPMMIKPISDGGTGASNLNSFITTLDVARSIDDGVVVFNGDGDIDKDTLPSVIYPDPALVGPSSAYWGEDVVITILNYDDDIAYSIVNNTGNSLVRDRDKITIKITNSFGQKSIFLNGKQFTFNILQFFVLAPSITSPVNGFSKLGLTAIFTSSIAYIANKIDTHIASDWQIATDSSFLNIVKETINDSTNLTSWSVSDLQLNTTYYVRVRYRTTNAGISSWSVVNQYKTKPSLYPDVEIAKLLASDGQASDYFGRLVAISSDGNTAIIGAHGDDDKGTEAGSAYIFVRSSTNWSYQAKLLASDGQANDNFGWSVAISGDGNTAIIGAYLDDNERGSDAGSAYIYVRTGTNWTYQTKLLATDGQAGDRFGYSVAISGDGNTAIIGAIYDDDKGSNAGTAYIFIRSGTDWTQQTKLLATDGQANDRFGYSVALSSDGNTAIIGAYYDDDKGYDAGAVYIFTRSGTNWTQQAKLLASDGQANDQFGISVAISGDGNTAIIGAYLDDNERGSDAGSAYIFVRSGTNWSYQAKLLATDGQAGDQFGISVAISGDGNTAIIGSYYDDTKGSTYIFVRLGTSWSYQTKLLATDGQASDRFGWSVALSSNGNTAIIGAYADDDKGTDAGSAYIFGTA